MYHLIVKKILKKAFAELNSGQTDGVLKAFHPRARHSFIGTHALSGVRNRPESRAQWYARLLALFPDIHFELHSIEVSGTPWNTCARVVWTETNTGTDGVRAQNTGINVFSLRWGKVTELKVFTDTALLLATLERLSKAGNPHASKPPIVDEALAWL